MAVRTEEEMLKLIKIRSDDSIQAMLERSRRNVKKATEQNGSALILLPSKSAKHS